MKPSSGLPIATALLLLAHGSALAQGCTAPPPTAGIPPSSINPVIVRVLGSAVTPVAATDGLVHLAYAAQVTNLADGPAEIESIAPVDALKHFEPTGENRVTDVDGKTITGQVRLFGVPMGQPRDFPTVPAGGSGVMFFDVTYPSPAETPRLLSHRVAVRLPGDSRIATLSDPRRIGCEAAIVLSPPLAGHGWLDGNGCCRVIDAHRGATLPLNGDLRVPEQFAIDFVQLTPDATCCTGPVTELRSWPFHGAPVLAAAAGAVVEASDDQPDQVPGPAKGVTVSNAAGNHVIQQAAPGHWIMYAHLRPHSVAVHVGQVLRAGQRIGEIGNSGSSTAPHLHFQVMDRPSPLNATGLPFVFDRQVLEGAVQASAGQAELDYEAGRPIRIERQDGTMRRNEMPLEGQVFGFHMN